MGQEINYILVNQLYILVAQESNYFLVPCASCEGGIMGERDTATHCNTLQHTATHCNTLQHTATPCNTLQHTTTYPPKILLGREGWRDGGGAKEREGGREGGTDTATHCNTLQHTATHCNAL